MSASVESRPLLVNGVSGMGGFLLLFGLLYLLSHVQREEEPLRELQTLDIRSVEVPSQEEDSLDVAQSASNAVSSLPQIPAQPRTIPSLAVEPMPFELEVDVSKVLEDHNTLEYLISQRDLFGAFGSIRLEGTDSIPKTLYLPPNIFPRELKEQGIYSGRVLLLVEISEQGIGRVRRVLHSDYPELVDPVIESIHGAIYSRPKRRGKPTRTIIKSLIHFRSSPSGENIMEEIQEK